jgi:rubrerythrin
MAGVVNSLKWMYNMERFATQVYRTQVRAFSEEEIAERLKAAAINEQQHVDNLRNHIVELKGTPSRVGLLFQLVGVLFSLIARPLGRFFILRTDVLIEKRAIKDYGIFLKKVNFDEQSVSLIHRIIEDEKRHVENWEHSVKLLKGNSPAN